MCELCDLVLNKEGARHTKVWFECDRILIIDCETCKDIPMVIFKQHTMEIKIADLVHILNSIYGLFGGYIKIRIEQRKIHDHLHWHIKRWE